jgi:hypothetical protein
VDQAALERARVARERRERDAQEALVQQERQRAAEQARREAEASRQAAEAAQRAADAAPKPPPAPLPAPPTDRSVAALCAGSSNFLTREACQVRACFGGKNARDPVCVRYRELEESRRRQQEQGN